MIHELHRQDVLLMRDSRNVKGDGFVMGYGMVHLVMVRDGHYNVMAAVEMIVKE